MRHLQTTAVDDVLDLFDVLMATDLLVARGPLGAGEQVCSLPTRLSLPSLVEAISLDATADGRPVLAALRRLPELTGRKKVHAAEVDTSLLAGSWRRLVLTAPATWTPPWSSCASAATRWTPGYRAAEPAGPQAPQRDGPLQLRHAQPRWRATAAA